MKTTSEKIQSTLRSIRELDKVVTHLDGLQQRLHIAENKKDELVELVNKEEMDLNKLQSLSLKGLFYKVLGSKEEQIEKERQEYLQAFMQLEEHNKEIELIRFEQNVLEEKRAKFTGQKETLEQLMKVREKELLRTKGPAQQRLRAIVKHKDQAGVLIWEIGEALQVGTLAVRYLEEMIHFLKGARNWGHWQSNRSNSTWQKYQRRTHIDQARERGHHAKQQLLKFQQELKDLYPNPANYAQALQLDFYQGFLARLFSNMISDWVLQQKIRNSLNLVLNVRDQVALELARLESERHKQNQQLEVLENEKNGILLSK